MKHFASAYPDFPILHVSLAELENEGHWVKKEIKNSLKICRFRIIFVPLHSPEPAKPLNDAQMCGSFYFLYISLTEILVFSNDSYFFVNIENMGENGNVLIIKGLLFC